MAGVDLTAVKELLGHKTITMTMRYAHLAPSHKVKAVAMLEQLHDNYMTIQANAQKKHPACELSAWIFWYAQRDSNPRPTDS